jgi:hypothetical protein
MTVLLCLAGCAKQPNKELETVSVSAGAPRCVIGVTPQARWNTITQLNHTIRSFALSNGFRECEVPHYSNYHGPPYADQLYKSDQFMIWSWKSPPKGRFNVAPHATNYSSERFQQLTNLLATTVRSVFSNSVEMTPRPSRLLPPGRTPEVGD